MTVRDDIVRVARSWVGVRFRHQGRTREGIDCVGILVVTAQELKLSDYDSNNYPRRPNDTFIDHFRQQMYFVSPVTSAQDGDALIFSAGGSLCHCGIMLTVDGKPGVIHATATSRSVVETTLSDIEDECGKPRYAFKFPGVED